MDQRRRNKIKKRERLRKTESRKIAKQKREREKKN